MVGNIVHRSAAEPIFRERLKQLDEEELAGAARTWIWQRETALYPYDEDTWRCECIKQNADYAETPTSTSTRRTTSWRNFEKTVAAKNRSAKRGNVTKLISEANGGRTING